MNRFRDWGFYHRPFEALHCNLKTGRTVMYIPGLVVARRNLEKSEAHLFPAIYTASNSAHLLSGNTLGYHFNFSTASKRERAGELIGSSSYL